MDSIPCDIVLLPNQKLSQAARAASADLQSLATRFVLDDTHQFAHMSLYMFQLTQDKVEQVAKALDEIAKNTPVIHEAATKYALGEGPAEGYIDAEYPVTNELSRLQMDVVEAINPMRSGMRAKDVAKLADADGVKRDNFEKYGYGSIGELFRPHLTITRLEQNTDEVYELLPDVSEFDGAFDRLGLFEMGDNGTCIRMLHEVSLVDNA